MKEIEFRPARRTTFSIPVFSYLDKYVRKSFFEGLRPPFKIEEDTLIGKQIISQLIDKRKIDMRGDKKIEMNKTLQVCLSSVMANRSPTLSKLIPINYYLDKQFKHDLITWIKSADECGVRPYPSSKLFLAHYGIDESEYSHDAAYKVWQRYKKQGYNNNTVLAIS